MKSNSRKPKLANMFLTSKQRSKFIRAFVHPIFHHSTSPYKYLHNNDNYNNYYKIFHLNSENFLKILRKHNFHLIMLNSSQIKINFQKLLIKHLVQNCLI